MAIRSLFGDEASIDVAGIWFVGRTTPIVYNQPSPDEVYLILGYNLGGVYPDRTPAQTGSEAVDPVDTDALVGGTAVRYVSDFAIRAESSGGAGDGMMRMQMADASDSAPADASSPFSAATLGRAVLAIQARPWNTIYVINLRELVDADGNFAWASPSSLRIGAAIWSIVSIATEIRTVIFDPDALGIDAAGYEYDDGVAAPVTVPTSTLAAFFPGPPIPFGDTANILWIDIVTDDVRHGPLRDISEWSQEEIWEQGSRFSFTAVQKGAAAHIDALSEIYVYSIVGGHTTLVGGGLVLDFDETPTETETTLTVTGIGFEHELLKQPPVDLSFVDTSHEDTIAALSALLPPGWSLESDPEINSVVRSTRLTGKTLLDAIRKCAEFFGTRLQFDFRRVIRMRTYYSPLAIVASEDSGLGARVTRFKRRTQAKDIVTVLHPFASDRRARLAQATQAPPDGFLLDTADNTVMHQEASLRYGELHAEHAFRNLIADDSDNSATIETANILLQLAVNRLREYAEPQQTIDIAVQAPRQMIRPFQLLPLQVRKPAIDDSFRVASVATTYDQTDGLRQSLTLTSQQSVRLIDDVSLLARQIKDIVEAIDFGVNPDVTYVGEVTTADSANNDGAALSFIAGPDDDTTVVFALNGGNTGTYEYAVDNGPWRDLSFSEPIDLSADIVSVGTHRLVTRLTPNPSTASRMTARVTVS